ncbi:hypothetical protein VTK26DRAFT_862 [Humicola hyalothermophila]
MFSARVVIAETSYLLSQDKPFSLSFQFYTINFPLPRCLCLSYVSLFGSLNKGLIIRGMSPQEADNTEDTQERPDSGFSLFTISYCSIGFGGIDWTRPGDEAYKSWYTRARHNEAMMTNFVYPFQESPAGQRLVGVWRCSKTWLGFGGIWHWLENEIRIA